LQLEVAIWQFLLITLSFDIVFQEKTLILKRAARRIVVAKPDFITINTFECLRTRPRSFYFSA
jgi:hypothetical protein